MAQVHRLAGSTRVLVCILAAAVAVARVLRDVLRFRIAMKRIDLTVC